MTFSFFTLRRILDPFQVALVLKKKKINSFRDLKSQHCKVLNSLLSVSPGLLFWQNSAVVWSWAENSMTEIYFLFSVLLEPNIFCLPTLSSKTWPIFLHHCKVSQSKVGWLLPITVSRHRSFHGFLFIYQEFLFFWNSVSQGVFASTLFLSSYTKHSFYFIQLFLLLVPCIKGISCPFYILIWKGREIFYFSNLSRLNIITIILIILCFCFLIHIILFLNVESLLLNLGLIILLF